MIPGELHAFDLTPAEAAQIQRKLRTRVITHPDGRAFERVVGADLALDHTRGFGIAGVVSLPGIGVAKSRRIGQFEEAGLCRGSGSPLLDRGETIGAVVRTRDRVKPVFVSIGHRSDLQTAVKTTLDCCDGYRIPKPTRIADQFVATIKRGRLSGP